MALRRKIKLPFSQKGTAKSMYAQYCSRKSASGLGAGVVHVPCEGLPDAG